MNPSATKGNNPELWEKLLHLLDDKLQLGLLDNLKKVASYHFEDETLFLQPSTQESYDYLTKDAFFQQLQLLVHDATGVEKVKIEKPD